MYLSVHHTQAPKIFDYLLHHRRWATHIKRSARDVSAQPLNFCTVQVAGLATPGIVPLAQNVNDLQIEQSSRLHGGEFITKDYVLLGFIGVKK